MLLAGCSCREGYQEFTEWKQVWSVNAKHEANIRMFVIDRYLPFWLQCNNCAKWREVSPNVTVTLELVQTYTCDSNLKVMTTIFDVNFIVGLLALNLYSFELKRVRK